ncbi:MAG: hypothetical protein NT149_04485 [Candidatus Gottesmanbacteria bacterium]|nr:hypothetical protein [Candidatus Gottesmanbacteria bacterium]
MAFPYAIKLIIMFSGELGQGKEAFAKLSSELERQADIYEDLGVTKDAIMKLLAPRPEGLPAYLIIPVVTLGTSVDLKRQADLAGIKAYYDLSSGSDTAGGITFDVPHLIWMQDGSKYLGKSVEWVRSHLEGNERPATQYDGVALGIVIPDFRKVLKNHPLNLPGTSVLDDNAPYLHDWKEGPWLGHCIVRLVDPDSGSATCGSISTSGFLYITSRISS